MKLQEECLQNTKFQETRDETLIVWTKLFYLQCLAFLLYNLNTSNNIDLPYYNHVLFGFDQLRNRKFKTDLDFLTLVWVEGFFPFCYFSPNKSEMVKAVILPFSISQ